ncbi:MAG: hypothetical protein ACRDTH_24515, partial [Pseudonocardiaceae bacterium]
ASTRPSSVSRLSRLSLDTLEGRVEAIKGDPGLGPEHQKISQDPWTQQRRGGIGSGSALTLHTSIGGCLARS